MYTFIIALHIIACIILIFIILMQSGKGAGLSEAFGGGGGGGTMKSLFGTKSTNVLTKVTIALVILFLLTSLTLTIFGRIKSTSLMERMEEEETEQTSKKEADEEEPVELPLNPGSMPMR